MPTNASARVSSTPKHWIIEFSEPMNRTSVEDTMKRNLLPEDIKINAVNIQFEWVNDRQLKVTTSLQSTELEDNRIIFTLSVNDALTSTGNKLAGASVFRAIVGEIKQIYRISFDGKSREKLSSFDKPYMFNKVLNDSGYIFTTQSTYYCECDARSEVLYDLFDYEQQTHVSYPVELFYSYSGEGDFFADSKGFFYRNPKDLKMPESSTEYHISLDGYIFGTGISKDRRYALVAVGEKDQKTDFDLVFLNLETGQKDVYAKAMKGYAPANQVSDGTMPITFQDDGKQVTFMMENKNPWGYEQYAFNWENRTVQPWVSPDGEIWWENNMTSDGVYRLSGRGEVYKNGVKQKQPTPVMYGTWVNNSHQLLILEFLADRGSKLSIFDADTGQISPMNILLKPDENFIGTSTDGKWIYVTD
ncbi:hypothetical protein [Paenibacillus roseipurpureus]|uniref:Uncharacterized protein n=1 Tax=Paenibacillus roseopurpureus TaxID=2918901 RepID=A0AA96LT37_9BACL|nr:hypothetical protein [Paenibacillus sp. MBLB1832]WNR46784.1 hypothetical protein MJB10_12040 [Paenibacillus sp. MBLB1832]